MSDKRLWLNRLFDFYSPLLTEKQREIFSMYYEDDSTLEEIAEEKGGSRQSVFDLLKRTEAAMLKYEHELHLSEKFRIQTEFVAILIKDIKQAVGEDNVNSSKLDRLFAEFNDKFENSYFE